MPSFDVVCKLDLQEVDNAINQTLKEVGQRFDFRGTPTEVTREEHAIQLRSADDFKVRALAEILREKLARRQVPLRALAEQPIEPGPAGSAKQRLDLQQGIETEKAREIVKLIKETKLKVQAAIQGDTVRVSSASKDELQGVIALLKGQDFGVELKFGNFRSN